MEDYSIRVELPPQVLPPSMDEGVELGLHGRISNTPAYNFYINSHWEGDDYWVWLLGKVRITSGLGENLLLIRKVSFTQSIRMEKIR